MKFYVLHTDEKIMEGDSLEAYDYSLVVVEAKTTMDAAKKTQGNGPLPATMIVFHEPVAVIEAVVQSVPAFKVKTTTKRSATKRATTARKKHKKRPIGRALSS